MACLKRSADTDILVPFGLSPAFVVCRVALAGERPATPPSMVEHRSASRPAIRSIDALLTLVGRAWSRWLKSGLFYRRHRSSTLHVPCRGKIPPTRIGLPGGGRSRRRLPARSDCARSPGTAADWRRSPVLYRSSRRPITRWSFACRQRSLHAGPSIHKKRRGGDMLPRSGPPDQTKRALSAEIGTPAAASLATSYARCAERVPCNDQRAAVATCPSISISTPCAPSS